jgi:hypothetical protein
LGHVECEWDPRLAPAVAGVRRGHEVLWQGSARAGHFCAAVVDMHAHTGTHPYTQVHTSTHKYTQVHTRTHTYTHGHTQTHMWATQSDQKSAQTGASPGTGRRKNLDRPQSKAHSDRHHDVMDATRRLSEVDG